MRVVSAQTLLGKIQLEIKCCQRGVVYVRVDIKTRTWSGIPWGAANCWKRRIGGQNRFLTQPGSLSVARCYGGNAYSWIARPGAEIEVKTAVRPVNIDEEVDL